MGLGLNAYRFAVRDPGEVDATEAGKAVVKRKPCVDLNDPEPIARRQALEADSSWALIVQAIEDGQTEVSYASAIVSCGGHKFQTAYLRPIEITIC